MNRLWPAAAVSLLLVLLWSGPLSGLAAVSFSAHMVLHLALVLIAAPLAVLALARIGALGQPRFGLGSALAFSALEMLVVWSWHAPAAHAAAALQSDFFALQQASFLVTGMLVWLPGLVASDRRSAGAGTVAMLGSFAHMTMLGVLLALAPAPIYDPEICGRAFGLGVAADQRLGGAIMAMGGGFGYLAAALWFAARLLGSEPPAREPLAG